MGLDMYGAPDLAFDFEAAQRVVTAADGAADALEGQTGSRASYVTAAETDFRSYYSELFAANAASTAGDRRELAVRLWEVSAFMGKLVAAAREENARRRRAREYKARVEQRRRNWVDATWDQIFGEEPPPREQAKAAPVFPAEVVRQAPRSPLAGTGAGSMTSTRPADLRASASGSAGLDAAVRDWPSRLRSAAGSFMATCDFGGIDVAPVVVGFEKWLAANAEDVRWANIVAAAFEASGAGSGVATVSDAALGAALAAAGVNARRDDLAIDPAQAFGGVPTTGFVNDPVNTSTGNFIEPESDLLFAGASASLSLSRMYN
ncbi:DUF6531 domain-containing protein [Leifsonia xyli]|uniref:DUF6531 domain-containing protein n=1 Tax=Leifsonia xyli TaxID=1575 RepID=UPI0006945DC5|nr:DUF6531 domain-containing protein [Leifsonia xyli]